MTAPKVLIVNFRNIEDRLDPKFYFALDEVRDRVAELKRDYPDDSNRSTHPEILRRIEIFPSKDVLLVLARGANPQARPKTFASIIEEYPHLSLALLEKTIGKHIEAIRASIENQSAKLDELLGIMPEAETTPSKGIRP